MKVEAVTLRELRMPLKYFFETSFGRTESRRVLLVTAHCEGAEGWDVDYAPRRPPLASGRMATGLRSKI